MVRASLLLCSVLLLLLSCEAALVERHSKGKKKAKGKKAKGGEKAGRVSAKWDSSCSSIGCGTPYSRFQPCQCNDKCPQYQNCCSDYDSLCLGGGGGGGGGDEGGSCASIGCWTDYDSSLKCQCNSQCARYGNCCSDFEPTCKGGGSSPGPAPRPPPPSPPPSNPAPAPPVSAPSPPATIGDYWDGVNTNSKTAVQQQIRSKTTKLSYGGLWDFYKAAWVNLPGLCQSSVYDIYSDKCWTPGNGQCGGGGYRGEGDCYNREHSWPKSWWGGSKNEAYSDVFHVMPSDGYVNGKRSAHPFGEVNNPSYRSNEGHKVGKCSTPGYSGTCFEPTAKTKGVVARGHLYMATRYEGLLGGSSAAVSGGSMKAWTTDLILKWHSENPPENWEKEWNNRAESWQGNRNPYIDFPELAEKFFG